MDTSAKPRRPLALLVAVGVVLAGAAWFGRARLGSRDADATAEPELVGRSLPVTEVLHEVALEPELWEIVERSPSGKPQLYVVTPSPDYRLDGGDLPALALPPPARVRFTVPDDGGAVELRGRTGVDGMAPGVLRRAAEVARVRFSVSVDGTEVRSSEHEVRADGKNPWGLCWKDFEPVPLRPGQVVELASEVLEPTGAAFLPPMPMGFGALQLVRHREKELVRATPAHPNVVLIVMDTLRQDRVSCYGYARDTTPAIDALAARGIVYENAYASASWTWPSTASILTGLFPETHGVLDNKACYLDSRLETLAELFSARRYVTGGFSCNPLIVPNRNFDQGFDHFDSGATFRHSSQVIDAVLAWIRANADARFFLYVQFADTHQKYELRPEALAKLGTQAPEGYPIEGLDFWHRGFLNNEAHDAAGNSIADEVLSPEFRAWMQDAYDGAVMTADYFVGQVLGELDAQGLTDRTVVAFTSDHGEELLDHGLLTHGQSLYPELTRVPLVLAGPGLPRGERVATPVANRHLAPSLAAFANATFAFEQDALDLKRPAVVRAQPIFSSTRSGWWNGRRNVPIYGVRRDDWELHWAPEGRPWGAQDATPGGEVRLYHVSADPAYRTDLAAAEPERAAELRRLLEAHLARAGERRVGQEVGVGRRGMEALIGIGYVEGPGEAAHADGGGAPAQDDEERDEP